MLSDDANMAFVIEGPPSGERTLAASAAIFGAYACLDDRVQLDAEAYLSAFDFTREMLLHCNKHGSVRAYAGPCGGKFAWIDIDRDDLQEALVDTKRMVLYLIDTLGVDAESILVFFSGAKGFHIGVPLHWRPEPSTSFPRHCRNFAERIAAEAGVRIDTAIYDHVRCFRAPNSRHPKTGLFKRHLRVEGIEKLSLAQVLELAKAPEEFEVPDIGSVAAPRLERMWKESTPTPEQTVAPLVTESMLQRRLTRGTVDFIREGAPEGERANRLFQAAAESAEFIKRYGIEDYVKQLLCLQACECGLTPSEAQQQFGSGWRRGMRKVANDA